MPAPGAYPIASTADGRVRWSDGSVTGNMSTPQGYASNVRVPNTNLGNFQTPITTGGGGGNNGGGAAPAPAAPSQPSTPGVDFNALLEQQRALARSAYDEGLRRASAAFERARRLYDEGIGALSKRREEFKGLFEEGEGKILDRYEQERGNLQASAQNAETRSRNALRALGLGGSAYVKQEGQQRQTNAKAAGELSTQRSENDRANQREYDSRLDWANTQESSLKRILADAEEARRSAENQSGLIYAGDVSGINSQMGNFLNSILNNQLALQTANAATTEKVANPYAVNISDLTGALTAQLPTIGGGAGQAAGGNVVAPNTLDELLALQRKAGVYGGGLYA